MTQVQYIPFPLTIGTSSLKIALYSLTDISQRVPQTLVQLLNAERNIEINRGALPTANLLINQDDFMTSWLDGVSVIAIQEEEAEPVGLQEGRDWENICVGAFNIKPNYPGRCSHICQVEFIFNNSTQTRELKKALGEAYLNYATKLGYTYAMFNVVFSNEIAFLSILKELGFGVVGRIPMSAQLENRDELVEALILGKELM